MGWKAMMFIAYQMKNGNENGLEHTSQKNKNRARRKKQSIGKWGKMIFLLNY